MIDLVNRTDKINNAGSRACLFLSVIICLSFNCLAKGKINAGESGRTAAPTIIPKQTRCFCKSTRESGPFKHTGLSCYKIRQSCPFSSRLKQDSAGFGDIYSTHPGTYYASRRLRDEAGDFLPPGLGEFVRPAYYIALFRFTLF